jgi:hypothetical protein
MSSAQPNGHGGNLESLLRCARSLVRAIQDLRTFVFICGLFLRLLCLFVAIPVFVFPLGLGVFA